MKKKPIKILSGAAIACLLMFGAAASSVFTANAAQRDRYDRDRDRDHDRYDRGRREAYRIAFDNGYRTGLDRGGDDARSHSRADPNRSQHYRDGDSGYHSEYGSKEAYRRAYREGFRKGYYEAYRRYSRGRRY